MNQQDDSELPVAERVRVLLVRDGQISEIAIGVKHDQQELNVLRRRDKKIDHDVSSTHPSTYTLACANAGDRRVHTRPLRNERSRAVAAAVRPDGRRSIMPRGCFTRSRGGNARASCCAAPRPRAPAAPLPPAPPRNRSAGTAAAARALHPADHRARAARR